MRLARRKEERTSATSSKFKTGSEATASGESSSNCMHAPPRTKVQTLALDSLSLSVGECVSLFCEAVCVLDVAWVASSAACLSLLKGKLILNDCSRLLLGQLLLPRIQRRLFLFGLAGLELRVCLEVKSYSVEIV